MGYLFYSEQKTIIAKSLGVVLFSDWKSQFILEVEGLVKTALKPKQIVHTLLKVLQTCWPHTIH